MPRRIISLAGGRRGVIALVAALAGLALIGVAWRAQVSAPQPHPSGRIDVAAAAPTADLGRSPSPARSHPLGPSRPVRIAIPAIGVHSAVFPIGKTRTGRLGVPQPGPRLNQVAWYRRSPAPGQPGPSVLLGHVDSVEGPSVFFRLGDVHPGDKVRIRRKDGTTVVFTVNAVRDFHKAHFPSRLVYGGADLTTPQLRLITCSDYVASIHHHIGDQVVFAHLTSVRHPRRAAASGTRAEE
jgi:hypothetical protein